MNSGEGRDGLMFVEVFEMQAQLIGESLDGQERWIG